MSAQLGGKDRDILTMWIDLGDIPDDLATRDYANRLLFKLWAAHQELEATLAELLALHAADVAEAQSAPFKRIDWPPRPLEPHRYAGADINEGYDLPCCDMPPDDDIHTMPADPADWHDHNTTPQPEPSHD